MQTQGNLSGKTNVNGGKKDTKTQEKANLKRKMKEYEKKKQQYADKIREI